jgi:hypothetical protein
MPGSCPYINAKGLACGKSFGPRFEACGKHRERPAAKPCRPCAKCGKGTKRDAGVCLGRSCGWNAYCAELRARRKTATAAARVLSADEAAAIERERLAYEAINEVADALEGLRPWPDWIGITQDAFEAEGDREAALQAADAAAMRSQLDAEAAFVTLIQAAEAEAAAATERDQAAREHLATLRRAYAGSLISARGISPTR